MPIIHTHTASPAGLSVNAFLIETTKGVVVIDATLTNSDSRALNQRIQAIGKPLLAVLLTHGHPDHVAGLTNLVAQPDLPIVALPSVKALMERTEAAKHAQWKDMFGPEWITQWTYPNQLIDDGQTVTFDGITYQVHDLGAGGDCDANAIWTIEAEPKAAFVGDLVFQGNHTYLADGALLRWLANLERFRPLLANHTLYVGHGQAGSVTLLDQQREYILTYCTQLLTLIQGSAQPDELITQQLIQQMEQAYPNYGLQFMIGLSAQRVAQELSGSLPIH